MDVVRSMHVQILGLNLLWSSRSSLEMLVITTIVNFDINVIKHPFDTWVGGGVGLCSGNYLWLLFTSA